jgi:hypothetical protein
MVDVKSARCTGKNTDGTQCTKYPTYNMPGKSGCIFCVKHKDVGMVDVKSRLCIGTTANGTPCATQPAYNAPGESLGIFCTKHKAIGMVNVKYPTCTGTNTDGTRCATRPVYNTPGESRGIFCAKHKAVGMVDVKSARCTGKNADETPCTKQPAYNTPGKSRGIFCVKHKDAGMVNVKEASCTGTNTDGTPCTKQPTYNLSGESRGIFCVKHKTAQMVDVKHAICKGTNADGTPCTTRPTYNLPCESHSIFCAKHKSVGMVDTENVCCVTPFCTTLASNKAYKGHCYRCFVNLFPDNKIVVNHRTKERAVADFIRSAYLNLTITFDRTVADGCSRRRPDILMDMGEYVIITEIDENQHSDYICTCENKRLMQLFTDIGRRPLVMIRFNPDQYYDKRKKRVASCWGHTEVLGLCSVKKNKKTEWAKRLATLKTALDLVIAQGTEKEIDVIHLYYDGF